MSDFDTSHKANSRRTMVFASLLAGGVAIAVSLGTVAVATTGADDSDRAGHDWTPDQTGAAASPERTTTTLPDEGTEESTPIETPPTSAPDEGAESNSSEGATATGGLDGDWSTNGADIVDANGVAVQVRGVNWFGFETQAGVPHGLWSRNAEEMIDQIADLGFNTIRLPFSAAMLNDGAMPNGINEQENPDLVGLTSLEVMDAIIDYAGTKGLAVILDRHALGPDNRHHLWYDEQFPAERLITDWELLAARYGDTENVIGADLYNEPHDEACWGCGDPAVDWKIAAEDSGNALHAIEPGWLLFVEGVEHVEGTSCDGPGATACTWWGGNLSDAMTEPVVVEVDNKVVYSPHEYATSVFRQSWFDDPTFPENMEPIWDGFWGDLETTNSAPVMVGEFGTTLDSDIDRVWLEALLTYMDDIGAGFTFWTFNPNSGDTGGILEDDWVSVDRDKMSFLEPYLLGPFPPVSS